MKFEYIRTKRILIRIPTVKDAKLMHEGLRKSIKVLKPWMPWAQELASLEDTKYFLKQAEATWSQAPEENVERTLIILDKDNKKYIGSTAIKPLNLLVPSFEVGYWVNVEYAGKGYITESINALTRYLFGELRANRVEIHCESTNEKSCLVAERLNYPLEAVLKNQRLTADNKRLADTKLYALTDPSVLPDLEVQWK